MLLRAAAEHEIDLAGSVMIGDSLSDMEAAKNAGVVRRYLLSNEVEGSESGGDCVVVETLLAVASAHDWI